MSAKIRRDLKEKFDKLAAANGSQVQTLESAIEDYVHRNTEGASGVIHFRIDPETRSRLAAYCRDEHHGAPQENVSRDALKLLLRVRDESQSEEFVVSLQPETLIDRLAVYRRCRESNRSHVAAKALHWYLLEQERHDAQYRAALKNTKRSRRGRG